MSIKSIRIKNILSFKDIKINNFEDINCIVGKNNAGKSNLLKCIRFFYNQLEEKRELPLSLNSKYSSFGTITIVYDISHIKKIVEANKNKFNEKLGYFKNIYKLIIKNAKNNLFELTLKINSDNSIKWDVKNSEIRKIINDIYPFFEIETRHISLYNWNTLWNLISRLKPFNPHKVSQKDIFEFFDKKFQNEKNYKNYENYITEIENNIETNSYNYKEKVLSFVKTGLKGQTFTIKSEDLDIQSDGTNSHKFVETFIILLISLTRKSYITPTLFVDEPEVGLHPKRNEELIEKIYDVYQDKKNKVPYPKIVFATHSPNIVKEVVKLFNKNHQLLHISKDERGNNTKIVKMNSTYKDERFLNIFSDNESRLFFSNFILFVEGETELEIFKNRKLLQHFDKLKYIDVYATNEVVLKYINPSYSNTSIPYLVLYDADKILKFDFINSKLKSSSGIINLNKIYEAYGKAYYNSEEFVFFTFLIELFNLRSKDLSFENNLYVDNVKMKKVVKYLNQYCLNYNNIFINRTTVEETLINEESFYFFKQWLFKEYLLFVNSHFTEKTPKTFKLQHKKNKIMILKNFINLIEQEFILTNFHNEKNIYVLFLLLFNGKTETLISVENANWKTEIPEEYVESFEKIEKCIFQEMKIDKNNFFGKTSGWTTKFLNFSIEKINKKNKGLKFETEFKKYFMELYDIINKINLSSDR